MLILLEGTDNVGKTTFARMLANRLQPTATHPVTLLHRGPPTEHALAEWEKPLQDYWPGSGEVIICDRWHLGEHVYGPLYRNADRLDPTSQWHIEAFLNSKGAVLVHLVEDPATLTRRHRAEKEDFLQEGDIVKSLEMYEGVVAESKIQSKIVGKTDHPDLLEAVVLAARAEEMSALGLSLVPNYVGPVMPTFLLVGERRGPTDDSYLKAFAPLPATSGKYLLDTLIAHNTSIAGMGLLNAVESEEQLGEMWDRLHRPPVVALGNEAYEACERQQVPAGVVPHPQYIRRFHHKRGQDYARAIRSAKLHGTDHRGLFRSST